MNFSEDEVLEILSATPVGLMKSGNFAPICMTDVELQVMCVNENDIFLRSRLEAISGRYVKLMASTIEMIEERREFFQDQLDLRGELSEGFKMEISLEDDVDEGLVSDKDGPIVKLIYDMIRSAIKRRASDIHIENHKKSLIIKYRVDGVLVAAAEALDKSYHSALISRLKVMAELDIAEKKIPQDGRFKVGFSGRSIDFRLSILPSIYGENAVLRILDGASQEFDSVDRLTKLGMSGGQLNTIIQAIQEPHGMVLVTGPTGSGKTTTLYSALEYINSGKKKIITIEDPVEYQLDGVMQIPVNVKKGLSFAAGLRSILRHDPDVMLVGEIRDPETAEIAIQSALTGHLVFSTLHANSAYDVFSRLLAMGVNVNNFMSSLNAIVSQRLIRTNCAACSSEVDVTSLEKQLTEMDVKFIQGNCTKVNYMQSVGCSECQGTGYRGRRVICEMLSITEAVKKSALSDDGVANAVDAAELVDGLTLRTSGLRLVAEGVVSVEELNRVTFYR